MMIIHPDTTSHPSEKGQEQKRMTRRRRRKRAEIEQVTGGNLFRSPFPDVNDRLVVISGKGQQAPEGVLQEMRAYFIRNGVPETECQIRHRYYLPTPSEEHILYVMIALDEENIAWKLVRTQCARKKLECHLELGEIPPEHPEHLLEELLSPFLPPTRSAIEEEEEEERGGGEETHL